MAASHLLFCPQSAVSSGPLVIRLLVRRSSSSSFVLRPNRPSSVRHPRRPSSVRRPSVTRRTSVIHRPSSPVVRSPSAVRPSSVVRSASVVRPSSVHHPSDIRRPSVVLVFQPERNYECPSVFWVNMKVFLICVPVLPMTPPPHRIQHVYNIAKCCIFPNGFEKIHIVIQILSTKFTDLYGF